MSCSGRSRLVTVDGVGRLRRSGTSHVYSAPFSRATVSPSQPTFEQLHIRSNGSIISDASYKSVFCSVQKPMSLQHHRERAMRPGSEFATAKLGPLTGKHYKLI